MCWKIVHMMCHLHMSMFLCVWWVWHNYNMSVSKKGYMHKLSCNPDDVLYVDEHTVLAGKDGRTYQGEAMGGGLTVVLFGNSVQDMTRPYHINTRCMHQAW